MTDLSLHVIDIIQNSLSAGATLIHLTVKEFEKKNLLEISIVDNGRGMSSDAVKSLENPFFTSRTTRRVGMGIPLFKDSALQSGGDLEIESEVGVGTTIRAFFELNHIDRPPLGDIANSFMLMVSANPEKEFIFDYIMEQGSYRFDTVEVKEVLEGMSIGDPALFSLLEGMIKSNLDQLKDI